MKKLTLLSISALILSSSAFALDTTLELAGTEVNTTSNTSMTASDFATTQKTLMSEVTGSVTSWYNIDTTTHYDIKIGRHYSLEQRPCVAYELTVKHGSQTTEEALNACLDYDNNWISNSLSFR